MTGDRLMRRLVTVAMVTALAAGANVAVVATGAEAATGTYANCTALNKKYKHGVGKKGARDLIKGKYVKGRSVTTFKVSTKIYNEAMKANKRLDGDKDGVACEKK
jgi:hypothetical protein